MHVIELDRVGCCAGACMQAGRASFDSKLCSKVLKHQQSNEEICIPDCIISPIHTWE